MISMVGYIVCGVIMVLVLPKYATRPYQIGRKTLLGLGVYALLGVWLFFDRRCYLDEQIVILSLALFGWWFFRCATSSHPWIALQQFTIMFSAAVLGLFLLTPEYEITGMMILVVTAGVNSVVAILQAVFHIQLMPKTERFKPNYAKGLIAPSPNFLGGYLVPHVFLALQLAVDHSWYWLPMLALLLYALWLTKCRAAMVGLVAGAIFAGSISYVITVMVLVVLGGFALFDPDMRKRILTRSAPIKDRLNFWRIAWLQLRRTPFGLGFDVMKTKVPFLQRELNEKTNGAFLDPKNYNDPKPERMHNDFIQHALDVGIPGLVGLLAIIYLALAQGPLTLQTAALVAILVNGLFIHLWYHPPTAILFWYLLGALLHRDPAGWGYWTFNLNFIHVGLYILLGVMVFEHIVKEQIFDFRKAIFSYGGCKDEGLLKRLLRMRPNESHIRIWAAHYYHAKRQFDKAAAHLNHVAANYDGGILSWFLYTDLGGAYYWGGSPGLAESAFEEALTFLPSFQAAQAGKQVSKIMMDKWRATINEQDHPVDKGQISQSQPA